ncbi:MAG: hypothetical protein MSS69_08820 [Spirochaetales bacterium]|nr:hypothetical protein [Spirochaetales bacterium]
MSDTELEKYRKMHSDIKRLYKECEKEMESLKVQNKTKTISFREAMGKKGFYAKILSMYSKYGIEDIE